MTAPLTLHGRPGYFLVVSLPDGQSEGGYESAILDAGNADREANGFPGAKAIFWQFWDEQQAERAVRHLVGDVPTDRPVLTEEEMKAARLDVSRAKRELRAYQRKHQATNNDLESAYGTALERLYEPKAAGVWAVCEAWLISKGTAAGKAGKKKHRGI